MSLIKQLWLAIIFIIILAGGGIFVLSTLAAKNNLETQLQMKNIDNATSLALSMSQMQKDPVTMDLLLSAQFDSGHYKYIGLYDPEDKVISEKINANSQTKAPSWFVKLIPIDVHAGVAAIQDGWLQYGSLKLESDSNFAYDKLWEETLLIALWSLLIGLISCYVGGKILKSILNPLQSVVDQANAISEHRFITIDAPKTYEFKSLVNAMNSLSNNIKKNVSEESARLNELLVQTNFDLITGLKNYAFFESKVDASISHEEFAQGVLITSRLSNLAAIDKNLGHEKTDLFLKNIGEILKAECDHSTTLLAGRLNGADFAVFSNQQVDCYTIGSQIQNLLSKSLVNALPDSHFITTTIIVRKTDTAKKLFTLVNQVLSEINAGDKNILHVIDQSDVDNRQDKNEAEWEQQLISALQGKRIKLGQFPVSGKEGQLIHYESPVRLQLIPDGNWLPAGEFISWAYKFNLINWLDQLVLEKALELLAAGAEPIGLNVSGSAICNEEFVKATVDLIKQHSAVAHRLYLEVPEKDAFNHFAEFRSFCNQLKPYNCKIGIEHIGTRISELGKLHDVGLDYLKVDVSVIKGIDSNEANKTLLRGLGMIAHSIGTLIIAEGVQTEGESETLIQLGIDGMTGPGVKLATP
ncbi:MAG TPA: EAL domain-containing protein [Methylotenera sp.]|nr:EAL domain-containing protein [Methylotenera sp.]